MLRYVALFIRCFVLAEATCGVQAHVYVVKVLDQIDAVKSSENPGTLRVRKAPNRSYAEKRLMDQHSGSSARAKKGWGKWMSFFAGDRSPKNPKVKKTSPVVTSEVQILGHSLSEGPLVRC